MKSGNFPRRGDIVWVSLDPTVGSEIKKRRPGLIISNDIANAHSARVLIAPLTSQIKNIYPFEVMTNVNGKNGKILLDQIRAVDKIRLGQTICSIDPINMQQVEKALKLVLALH